MNALAAPRAPAPDLYRASRPGLTPPHSHPRRSSSWLSSPGSQHGRARGPPCPFVAGTDPEHPGPRTRLPQPLPLGLQAHREPPMPPILGITMGHRRPAGTASAYQLRAQAAED
ncbi:hypothetical protein NDU88_006847 [Pleurodeles waltl]|uniref:Uncharacterized protein n=1 Tax=Pleurodeles waltl TaxID=8319 RepID=A0AAV7N4N4_PLEWA|nr:hypothetical protein NDU88_006847 [Pleurodeles waltl]